MRYFLTSPTLEQFPQLKHAFTTRLLNDDYDRIAVKLKILSSQIYYLDQIHSGKVVYLSEGMNLKDLPAADAIITDRKDVYIGVRTADCIPLLVYDPENEVVAAIHAGYKGLLEGVIQNTLKIMTENFSSNPQELVVAMGPCICVEHYEMGYEVIEQFEQKYGQRFSMRSDLGPKPHLDVKATARMIIEDCGVDMMNFEDIDICTHEHDDMLYSYRRDQNKVGRQFNCIGMISPAK